MKIGESGFFELVRFFFFFFLQAIVIRGSGGGVRDRIASFLPIKGKTAQRNAFGVHSKCIRIF